MPTKVGCRGETSAYQLAWAGGPFAAAICLATTRDMRIPVMSATESGHAGRGGRVESRNEQNIGQGGPRQAG